MMHFGWVFGPGLRMLGCLALCAMPAGLAAASDGAPAAAVSADVPAAAAAAISSEPSPAWLAHRELPAATPERMGHAQDGIVYLLTDWQLRGTDAGYDTYYRIAVKVANRSGLEEAGQLSFTLDPRIETIGLNFVHVIRDGKVIDRTADARFTVVERESDLSDGIISGSFQAISNLKDIRVGDIVDYGATRHVRTTLWPGHYFASFTDRFSEPLAYRAIRIQWPKARPLTLKPARSDIAFKRRDAGDMTEWEWIGVDRPFGPGENNVPAWFPQYGRIDISSMTRWSEVAAWAAPLYAGKDALTPEFERRLAEIATRWSDPADRVTEVTRYIQDNIRYVGEEMGEGSYVPRPPALVLERGYGDCKDKSLLLAVALGRLGIDAVPALVSTTEGDGLPDRSPSPLMFDHVVVRVALGGRVLWLDPTGAHRGGRGLRLVPSNLGYALPIRAGQAALEKMEGYAALAGAVDVVERFAVDETAATAMTLSVETRHSDAEADAMRARMATSAAADIARGNLTFYQKSFAGLVESKPLALSDDRDANVVVMVESYSLSKAAFDEGKILSLFPTNAYLVRDLLPDRQAAPRREPLALPANVRRTQTIEVTAKGRTPGKPDDVLKTAGDISFARTAEQSGETSRVRYELNTGARATVPPEGSEAIYVVSDTIGDQSAISYHLDRTNKPSEAAEVMASAAMKPHRADIERVAEMMKGGDQSKFVEALTIVNGVAEKIERPSPAAGLVDGMKGAILAGLNRRGPAIAAFLSSVEQYPGNDPVIAALIILQIDARDVPGVLKTMKTALRVRPTAIAGLDKEWMRMLGAQIRALPEAEREPRLDELCIVLASAGWGVTPRTAEGDYYLECAAEAHVRRGALDKARAIIALGLPADALAGLAIDRRFQAIWPDLDARARAGFKASIDAEIAVAAKAAKDAPDDFAAAMRHVSALRVAGRADEAVAAGRALAGRRDRIEAIGEPAFWFVNQYADALADAGRIDEAIAQMDGVLALGIDSYPELVSQAINRTEMLGDWGRHAEALAALEKIDDTSTKHASLYGKMWIWAGKACALRELGRGGEADAFDKRLAENMKENRSAVTQAAACRGDEQTIEQQLIARLDDPIARNAALGEFMTFAKQDGAPFERKLRAIVQRVRARPAVQAKLTLYGRVLPYAGTRGPWGDY